MFHVIRPYRTHWGCVFLLLFYWCSIESVMLGFPFPAAGEWYVAGFGGITSKPKITDVEMPRLGESLTLTTSNPDLINETQNPLFQLTQNLETDNVHLKRSWVAGGKVGYFFNQFDFPWLGIEVEAFLTNPKVKSQVLSGTQTVTRFDPTPSPSGPSDNAGNPDQQPVEFAIPRSISLDQSNVFVTTVAVNGVLRYPGDLLQPYVGVGIGAFWFKGTKEFAQSEVVPGLNAMAGLKVKASEAWGLFFEAKYNRATLQDFGSDIGLKGNYSILQWLGGVSYHF